jgi:orotate phosphoribosyltransferase
MLRKRLKELVHELGCIKYGRFRLASGGVSNYKIECDALFENSKSRNILSILGYQIFQKIEKTYQIVGVVTGGYEFAKLVAKRAGKEIISVNPHNGEVRGQLKQGNACYFEDVVTKGGSILKSRNYLGKRDKNDNHAIIMIDREEGGKEILKKNGIELDSILTKTDLDI